MASELLQCKAMWAKETVAANIFAQTEHACKGDNRNGCNTAKHTHNTPTPKSHGKNEEEENEWCCQYILCAMFGPEKIHTHTVSERACSKRRMVEWLNGWTNTYASHMLLNSVVSIELYQRDKRTHAREVIQNGFISFWFLVLWNFWFYALILHSAVFCCIMKLEKVRFPRFVHNWFHIFFIILTFADSSSWVHHDFAGQSEQ